MTSSAAIAATFGSVFKHTILEAYIVHPESFSSNAQIAIAFARRNRPRVDRNDEFACVYLRSRACVCVRLRVLFVIDRVCVRACVHAYIRI